MILSIISIVIIATVTIVGALDIVPVLKKWLLRIHIGRYEDKKKWEKSVSEVVSKWLKKVPKIKVTDNERLIIIDMLKGNYTKDTIQHWQEAALVLGANEYSRMNNDKEIKKSLDNLFDKRFNNEGQWKSKPNNIDCAILAYALMSCEDIYIDKYEPALDYVWKLIEEHIGEDGTVLDRKSMKKYRYVDTIGFICPFLMKYGIKYNNRDCIDLAFKQIQSFIKYGIEEKYNTPYHVYQYNSNIRLGLCGWGRGLGWYAIGLIDSYKELPAGDLYKKELESYIKVFADEIIKLQKNDGSWSWIVFRDEIRSDSSATAILCWFLLNASKIFGDNCEYKKSAEKAMGYLMSVTRYNGEIDFSQGDTKDIGIYSLSFDIMPFTQGFALRALSLL
jgi:unsaturated rhamnogalacturonyl hydrolase